MCGSRCVTRLPAHLPVIWVENEAKGKKRSEAQRKTLVGSLWVNTVCMCLGSLFLFLSIYFFIRINLFFFVHSFLSFGEIIMVLKQNGAHIDYGQGSLAQSRLTGAPGPLSYYIEPLRSRLFKFVWMCRVFQLWGGGIFGMSPLENTDTTLSFGLRFSVTPNDTVQ